MAVRVLKWLFQTWLKIPGQKFSQSKLWSSESIGHSHTSELYLWNTVVQASPACLSLCKAMMVLVMMVQQYTRAGENSVPSGQPPINFGTCPWTIVYSPYKQRFKLVCRFRGGLTKSQSDLIAKAFPKENQTHDIVLFARPSCAPTSAVAYTFFWHLDSKLYIQYRYQMFFPYCYFSHFSNGLIPYKWIGYGAFKHSL